MTREQKLALIVGFALVLVVGILISDHLSPAALDEPIGALAFGSPLGELPPAVVIDDDPGRGADPHAGPAGTVHEPEAGHDGPPAGPPAARPPARGFDTIEFTQGVSRITDDGEVLVPLNPAGARDTPKADPAPGAGPGFPAYVVRRGDTLSKIAAAALGSAGRWKELADLNRDRVGADGSVREGVTLRLPQGADAPGRPATGPGKADPASPAARTYAVRSGDTLGQIAQRELGTVKRTGEILALNHIDDADEIFVGLVLRLPAR